MLPVTTSGSRVPMLPVTTSGRRVQNSTRKPEVAGDIMYSARAQIHVVLRTSTQYGREWVHCGVAMEPLPDRVPVLPVESYPNQIPEENATRLSSIYCTCAMIMYVAALSISPFPKMLTTSSLASNRGYLGVVIFVLLGGVVLGLGQAQGKAFWRSSAEKKLNKMFVKKRRNT